MLCTTSSPIFFIFNLEIPLQNSEILILRLDLMESTDSSSGSQHPQLPPGFRFHPTDEELVVHYLKKKAASAPLPVTIITDIDLYKFDPWELPSKATFGEQEWYFFSPRDRKYPNGARPNRAATSGYWKATGTDKPILTANGAQKVGVKKALVFYGGKPPRGIKTNWIMHEYRLVGNNNPGLKPSGADAATKKGSLRLDDWVLCRIYKKNNSQSQKLMESDKNDSMKGMFSSLPISSMVANHHSSKSSLAATKIPTYDALLEHDENNFFEGILTQEGGNIQVIKTNHLPPQYWNEAAATSIGASKGKRFLGDLNNGGDRGDTSSDHENTSFVSLLNQVPPTSANLHPNNLLGSLSDGVFRQQFQLPSMNWNS